MRSASEYRQHAKDCRALAKGSDGERRQQTLRMAQTWEDLACEVDRANGRRLWELIRATYDRVAHERQPEVFQRLLKKLESAEPHRR